MKTFFTCYRSRAETDLAVFHATLRTIQRTIDFQSVADRHKAAENIMYEWVYAARDHWPDPLTKLEAVFTVSVLDVYAQSLMFALRMKQLGLPFATYSADWNGHGKSFKKWMKNRSTQNLQLVLDFLQAEFHVHPAIPADTVSRVTEANAIRNKFIHASLYINIHDPATKDYWMRPDPAQKTTFTDENLGELPRLANEAIGLIDVAALTVHPLPCELLMYRESP
jgi:hypothetical protein